MIFLLTSLLIWASLSIGGAEDTNIPSNALELKVEVSNGGWNDLGHGFLDIFTPEKLTDEHWQIIGKMKKDFDPSLIKEFAFSMGGVVFLVVFSILLMLLFCAAPIAYCVFKCTCKKKCKPKSNAIVMYSGLACNSIAILTISIGILFCLLSIMSLKNGIAAIGSSVEPLPGSAQEVASKLKGAVGLGVDSLEASLTSTVEGIPAKLADKVWEIKQIQDVMKIDIDGKIAKIAKFSTDAGELSGKLDQLDTEMRNNPNVNLLATPLSVLGDTKTKFGAITNELKSDGIISTRLNDVKTERTKTTKSTIQAKIEEQTKEAREEISKVAKDLKKKVDDGFNTESVKKEVAEITDKIKSSIDEAKNYLDYSYALMLVLIPCYLVLGSAIWSCCAATKFVQKKKAKPLEKGGLLIPLAIGFGLAFLPLLFSTTFAMSASVVNVVCGTVFKDESFGFLPNALRALDVQSPMSIKGINVDIPSFLQDCKSHKPMIAAMKGESLLDENMVIKQFDIEAKKIQMTESIRGMQSLNLPSTTGWNTINTELGTIQTKRQDAKLKIDELRTSTVPIPGQPTKLIDMFGSLKTTLDKLDTFMAEVETFENECKQDIATAQALNEGALKDEMVKIMVGDGATPGGLLLEMRNTVDGAYKMFRTELLTQSTNCDFLFATFKSVGGVVCDQAFGGLNGIYAAIGLCVMSFFSAAFGTVMIWHSLRAGKEKKEKGSDESNKKNKKKEGGEGGEEEEESPNMAGKIGEQADPMKKPLPSDQTPPAGQAPGAPPPALVQAVPTDPAAPGEKTNPSLLPNDAPLVAAAGLQPESGGPTAGTPLSPNPIEMVNMETNNNQDDKQNSITGAGGETAGGTAAQ